MNKHENNDPRAAQRQAAQLLRVRNRLLVTIGVLIGLIGMVVAAQHDLFGLRG